MIVPMTICIQDWTVMTVNIGDWRHSVDRRSKCKLLYDLIKEQTGYESPYLLNDGRMDIIHKKYDTSEETGIVEDDSMTAANHSTGTKAEEIAKLDDEELTDTAVHMDLECSSKHVTTGFKVYIVIERTTTSPTDEGHRDDDLDMSIFFSADEGLPDHGVLTRVRREVKNHWSSLVKVSDMSQDNPDTEKADTDAENELHSLLKPENSSRKRGRESKE